MDIHYEGLYIKFKMYFEENFTLKVDWELIEMDEANI